MADTHSNSTFESSADFVPVQCNRAVLTRKTGVAERSYLAVRDALREVGESIRAAQGAKKRKSE